MVSVSTVQPSKVSMTNVFVITPNRRTFFFPETENLNFGDFQGCPSLTNVTFLSLKASKLPNLKASSIFKQFSVTKNQIFSFKKEKCSSVWRFDKNIIIF